MAEEMIARVAVDVPLANLDRPFDYRIPAGFADQVSVGVRVRVRFAGRIRDGYVVEVVTRSDRAGLLPLHQVVSAEPVLTTGVIEVVRAVADHYAGAFSDVVRLAVPPRHGLTEKATPAVYPEPHLDGPAAGVLGQYRSGADYLGALARGATPRACWTLTSTAGPEGDWTGGLLDAAAATLRAGRGVLLLAPDATDLSRLSTAANARFGVGSHVLLHADAGPAARYRAFLALRRGAVRLAIGTRSAVFAPVPDIGLIALWDDGDDSWAEPRAPYPHAREVAALRSHLNRSALLYAGYARTAELQALVERGWLHSIAATPAENRARSALIRTTPAATDPEGPRARVPHEVFTVVRKALAVGPVIVQVPRSGYHPALACRDCGQRAECPTCGSALVGTGGPGLLCRWCGPLPGWRCPQCQGARLRRLAVGVERTTEEFGRAFPGTPVAASSGESRLADVGDRSMIVMSTPGAEPRALGGFAAAVLLDTQVLLGRADLRASEEALRRWLAVTALVRPAEAGGTVVAVSDQAERPIQALVRLDAPGYAARELAERREAGFPPALKLVSIEGAGTTLAQVRESLDLPGGATAVGPFPLETVDGEDLSRLTLRAPLPQASELVASVRTMLSVRAAAKAEGALRVRVDPQVL